MRARLFQGCIGQAGPAYRHRRAALEALLGRGLPDGLVLTPSTLDAAVARSWLTGHGAAGIEGVVAKRLAQPYRPGVRGWQKLPRQADRRGGRRRGHRTLDAPRVLLLGRHDTDGHLHLVGRTDRSPRPGAPRSPRCCARRTGSGIRGRTRCRPPAGAGPARPPPTPPCGRPWSSRSPSTPRSSTTAGATPPASCASVRTCAAATSPRCPLSRPRPPTAAGPGRVAPGGNRPAHRVDGAGVVPRGDLDISFALLIATAASLSAPSTAVRAT